MSVRGSSVPHQQIKSPAELLKYRQEHSGIGTWNSSTISSRFLSARLDKANGLYHKDLQAHFGCVNAIEFSKGGNYLVSGGDDRRVLLWNLNNAMSCQQLQKPQTMCVEHNSNIFSLAFNNSNSRVFSAGNDEQVIVHDVQTGEQVDVFVYEEAVYGLSVSPCNDNVFASAGEDGQLLLCDTRKGTAQSSRIRLAKYYNAFHSVQFHPIEENFLVSSHYKEGIALWDTRHHKKPWIRYGENSFAQSSMSARFNRSGTQIVALRRRLPPVLYNTHSSVSVCQFDAEHYYNSCTMKSCSFAGSKDQFILSGSDDFNLYMWKLPEPNSEVDFVDSAHIVLRGHRSIVNQVRFSPENFIIASSGVEKIIKLWTSIQLPGTEGSLLEDRSHNLKVIMSRKVYTHEEYIGLVLDSGQNVNHDYSHGSLEEDPRMMAFFDSLVQREVEGWTSNTDYSSTDEEEDVKLASSTPVPSAETSTSSTQQNQNSSTPSQACPVAQLSCSNSSASNTVNSTTTSSNSIEEDSNWILKLIVKKRSRLLAARKSHNQCREEPSYRGYIFQPGIHVRRSRLSTGHTNVSLDRSQRSRVAPYTVTSMSDTFTSQGHNSVETSDQNQNNRTGIFNSNDHSSNNTVGYINSSASDDLRTNSDENSFLTSYRSLQDSLHNSGSGNDAQSVRDLEGTLTDVGNSATSKLNGSQAFQYSFWSSPSSSDDDDGSAPIRKYLRMYGDDSDNSDLPQSVSDGNYISEIIESDSSSDDGPLNGANVDTEVNSQYKLHPSNVGRHLCLGRNGPVVRSSANCNKSSTVTLNECDINGRSVTEESVPISTVVNDNGSVYFDINESVPQTSAFTGSSFDTVLSSSLISSSNNSVTSSMDVGTPASSSSYSAMSAVDGNGADEIFCQYEDNCTTTNELKCARNGLNRSNLLSSNKIIKSKVTNTRILTNTEETPSTSSIETSCTENKISDVLSLLDSRCNPPSEESSHQAADLHVLNNTRASNGHDGYDSSRTLVNYPNSKPLVGFKKRCTSNTKCYRSRDSCEDL